MMSEPLRILMLEDSPADAELNERALSKEGIAFTSLRVETRAAFVAALDEFHPDLILADYKLPAFDGLQALAIVRERSPGLPYILVSGAIGEELAVKSIKQGASDYILKDNLARLPLAVQYAMEREKAEQINKQLVALIEASGDFIGFADAKDTCILFINSAGRKMCGIAEDADVTQLKNSDVHPEWANKLLRNEAMPVAIKDGIWEGECAFLNLEQGHEIPVLMVLHAHKTPSGEIRVFSTISRDITERKRMEAVLRKSNEELRQSLQKLKMAQKQLVISGKLASVGQLSAGVCHEILNPINVISLLVQMLSRKSGDAQVVETMEKIKKEISRVTKITGSLMTFARKGSGEKQNVRVVAELESVLTLVEREFLLDNIKIVRDLAVEPLEVRADLDEMRQVFFNIVNNARYAMQGGGTLTVVVEKAPGDCGFVRIKFADTGAGIKKENLGRVFDPFFTTKPEGQGTGMGLSVVYSLIEKVGGTITVESEEGKGATFIIDLPGAGAPVSGDQEGK